MQVFEEKPNPTEAEKKKLATDLGMDLKQVQTWFQNKRQRVKTQENAKEVQRLTSENQQLNEKVCRFKCKFLTYLLIEYAH